jgi:lipoprotein-anchoring transpeptidase ErfK/SrfK
VNSAQFRKSGGGEEQVALILKAQILLDRAHISPGAIDGYDGENTKRSIRAFQLVKGLEATGQLNDATWSKLTEDESPVLTKYQVKKEDVAGPFLETIPRSIAEMAKLDHLSYTSPRELLAEKFHMDQDLLAKLNKDADFSVAGTEIVVAAVRNNTSGSKVRRLVVDKSREGVIAFDANDNVVAYYPATIGSADLPSPDGSVEVLSVTTDPAYYYNPEVGIKGGPKEKMKIAPGPNGPVGTTWIDLSKDGYGIHGTSEPATVGKAFSHGCVRLTNWDARELGHLVRKGTPVVFSKGEYATSDRPTKRVNQR